MSLAVNTRMRRLPRRGTGLNALPSRRSKVLVPIPSLVAASETVRRPSRRISLISFVIAIGWWALRYFGTPLEWCWGRTLIGLPQPQAHLWPRAFSAAAQAMAGKPSGTRRNLCSNMSRGSEGPGSGKTMLAKRLPTILPEMGFEEALETTKVYSVVGLVGDRSLIRERPFRAPHHTISDAGLIGGGSIPRPGEVSLAHNGVLFLDELPEFKKNVLEVLRQPLEDGKVTIARAAQTLTFPSRMMLIAAMNPCPCGHSGSAAQACTCSEIDVQRYRARVSGPLMDRIDIHVTVPPVRYRDLSPTREGETSQALGERVRRARARQIARFSRVRGTHCNAQMSPRQIRRFCEVDPESSALLQNVIDRVGMSARAYDRILKVARTIADLEESEAILSRHVSEAISYRTLDRKRTG